MSYLSRSRPHALSMRGRGVEGKPEMECRAHTRLTFHPALPFVRIDYVLHDLGAEFPPFLVLTALAEKRRSRISGGIPRPVSATASAILPEF